MLTQNIVVSYVAASTISEFDLVKFDADGKLHNVVQLIPLLL